VALAHFSDIENERRREMKRSAIVLAGIAAAATVGYAAFARPRHLRYGTTWRERSRIWAGDELMPSPYTQSTRVITIHAPAEHVWPWIAQIGQDRGGFYSYTPLENLVGAEMKNADEIHEEWQDREVGDKLWLGAPSHFDGKAFLNVARWVPGRSMVLVAPPDWERIRAGQLAAHMVWAFILEPLSPKSCRLILRSLGGEGVTTKDKIANYLFWEPAHFIMERGMMLGIKTRAEAPKSASLPSRIFKSSAVLARAAMDLKELMGH
jgi:hypothetical protein